MNRKDMTFKILSIRLPEYLIQVGMSLQEFQKLTHATKSLVFENNDGFLFLADNPPTVFFTKKQDKQKKEAKS